MEALPPEIEVCHLWGSEGGCRLGWRAVFAVGKEGAWTEAEGEVYYALFSPYDGYHVLMSWHVFLGTKPTSITIWLLYLLTD